MMTYQLLRCNLYEYLKLKELEDPFSCGVHTLKEACLAMGRKMTVSRPFSAHPTFATTRITKHILVTRV